MRFYAANIDASQSGGMHGKKSFQRYLGLSTAGGRVNLRVKSNKTQVSDLFKIQPETAGLFAGFMKSPRNLLTRPGRLFFSSRNA
jgi:hypothetical protein